MDRTARVGEEIKKEVSDLIKNSLKDPRLPEMLSIIDVEVSRDFSHAKIFYSVMCSEEEKKEAQKALTGASGFIRRELGQRIKLRRTPELQFVQDSSIEKVAGLSKLIEETIRDDNLKKNSYIE
ncbi:MAG: 30S ribosome-binding factor RbfA [Oscillospiraceae bacterium]|nr:30S ribosome-binding factor RbfA [Oscillospiraceae bacterium]